MTDQKSEEDLGVGIDAEVLRKQVDELTPAAKKLVADRLAEIEQEKIAAAADKTDYAHMPENEFRQILHKLA
jgi:hypothetical protein